MKDNFSNQFATQRLRSETTTTTGPVAGSATMTPGNADFYTTKKKKTKKETKDVEPKLAAGKAKVYPKNKWGWNDASSIPNRHSKRGFIYKQLYESENMDPYIGKTFTVGNVTYTVEKLFPNGEYKLVNADGYETTKSREDLDRYLFFEKITDAVSEATGINKEDLLKAKRAGGGDHIMYYKIPNSDKTVTVDVLGDELEIQISGDVYSGIERVKLNENYSRFKKETKTRTNEQQLHAAMRLAERKIHEANRILEYTAQLRGELNETRTNKNTQRLMEKITRGIAEAYSKMKKLK